MKKHQRVFTKGKVCVSPIKSPNSTYGLAAWWWFVTGFVQLTNWFTHMMLVVMAAAALVMVVSRRRSAHALVELRRWPELGWLDHFAWAFPIAQVCVEETDL